MPALSVRLDGLEKYVHEQLDDIKDSLKSIVDRLEGRNLTVPGVLAMIGVAVALGSQFIGPLRNDIEETRARIAELEERERTLERVVAVLNDRLVMSGLPPVYEH